MEVGYAVTRALIDAPTEDAAIEGTLATLGEQLGWEAGLFWRRDENPELLEATHVWHADPELANRFLRQNREFHFQRGEGLPGRVWTLEAPLWIGDVARDPEFPRSKLAIEYGLHGGVAFPVYAGHDLVGVIESFTTEEIVPDEDFVQVLGVIGSELGQFIRRLRAEQQLRSTQARFQALTDTASDAIVTIDEQSIIRYANPATEKLFGYKPAELSGRRLTELMPERLRESHDRGIERYLRTGQKNIPWSGVELTALHRSGREFPVEISFGEFTADGVRRFTGIMRDVTERARHQQQLEDATAELEATVDELQLRTREAEAAAEAKSGFLAAMSHELRTPLQAVIGYSGLLIGGVHGQLSDDQLQALDRIKTSAHHLLSLIDQVLDLARSEAGTLRLKREKVDLCALAAETVELVRPQAESKGLDLTIGGCDDSRMHEFMTDVGRVRQIVLNLLSNAVKFTAEGSIKVTFEVERNRACIHVTDTGAGIAPDQLSRVFEPFYQTEAGLAQRTPGMGLGLAISRDLADSLGGSLDVHSEAGKGSRFTLCLPLSL